MKKIVFVLTCMVYTMTLVYARGMRCEQDAWDPPVFSMRMGVTLGAIGASTVIPVKDMFKLKSAGDPEKLFSSALGQGSHTGITFDAGTFFQFTVKGVHTVKFSTIFDGLGSVDESKELVELFNKIKEAKDNPAAATALLNKSIFAELNTNLELFADTGVMYQFKQPAYDISARLAYFVPLAYMEHPQAKVESTRTGNNVHVHAEGEAMVYGAVPAAAAQSGKQVSAADLFKNGGFDVSVAGSYVLTNWATLTGGIKHIPLVPAKSSVGAWEKFTYDSDTDVSTTTGGVASNSKTEVNSRAEGLPEKKIMRLCKLSIGADFRPLKNNYLILSPSLAFPLSSKMKSYCVDGSLKVESRFVTVLGVYFETGYIDRLWRHELGFCFDSRLFMVNVAAALAGNTFTQPFTKNYGLGFKLGLGVGF